MYSLIRQIVLNLDGFTVNDILDTDYYRLMDILNAEKSNDKQEVMSLHDFVNTI